MIRRLAAVVLVLLVASPQAVADRDAPLAPPATAGPWGKQNRQRDLERRREFLVVDGDVYLSQARQSAFSSAMAGRGTSVGTPTSDGFARHALDRYDEALRLKPSAEVHIRALAATEFLLESSPDRWTRVVKHFDGLRAVAPRDPRETTLIPAVMTALSKLGAAGGPDADANFERAVREFELWYQRIDDGDPRLAQAISTFSTNSAELLMALGPEHLEHAIRLYEQGIQFYASESLAYYGAAVAYDRDGQWTKAVEYMQMALERDPIGRPDWNDPRGIHRMGRLTSEGVYFVPEGELAYYYALGFQVQGQRADALRWYRRYLVELPATRFAERTREHIAELERGK
jgi:tetratricopeptide (TPR) repeat protein